MERKDFLTALGLSAGSLVISSCLGACGKSDTGSPDPVTPTPTPGGKLDFTLDVSSNADINTFPCSLTDAAHGSVFDSSGARVQGPATSALKKYSTTLTGSSLRVFEA